MQGSLNNEEYFLSDEESGSSSDNRDTGEDSNIDEPECSWPTDPDANEPWFQPWSLTNEFEQQLSHTWPDLEGPQVEVDWDLENREGVYLLTIPSIPLFEESILTSLVPEPKPPQREEGIMIDTLEKLDAFLPTLSQLKDGVELALDCEGSPSKKVNGVLVPSGGFGRNGYMSFLSMTIISMKKTYIFDVWQLKRTTFERQSKDGLSLKQVLESHDRIQLWWDVRGDWDILFHRFGIQIGKVRDLQLMEVLSRQGYKGRVSGLLRTMKEEGKNFMSPEELEIWIDDKEAGSDYFKRHNWQPLIDRPINAIASSYISGDTDCLFQLHNQLVYKLYRWAYCTPGKTVTGLMELIGKQSTLPATLEDIMEFIDQESARRAHHAISPEFDSSSKEGKTIPPPAFLQISRT